MPGSTTRVAVPFHDTTLPAYFTQAPATAQGPAPVMIMFNGLDSTKEQMYTSGWPQEMRERQAKYEEALAAAKEKDEDLEPFDELGGVGFNPNLDPHPECPECFGEGRGRVMFKDSRKLSPAGLALYTGAKIGKEGIEIKTRSQERASEMLARILKLYEDKSEININFSVEELNETFASRMAAAHANARKVQEERGLPDSA